MEQKKFTQFGTLSVLLMLPLFLLFTIQAVRACIDNKPAFFIPLSLSLIFFFCLLIFYKLTIIVDHKTVSFRMGIGLVHKTYKMAEIKTCKPVRNSLLMGIGIRVLGNGMLYNVTGLKAIELRFKYKSAIIRIGTDRPEEISQLIQSLVAGEEIVRNSTGISYKKRSTPIWIGILLLLITLSFIPSLLDTRAKWNDKELKIKGMYGMTIPYSEITRVDTVSQIIPGISRRTNGYAFGNTLIGNFKMADNSPSKLFIKKGVSPYIMIQSRDRVPVYINFKDNQKTRDLFMALKQGELLPNGDLN